jgi:hypothetical protein
LLGLWPTEGDPFTNRPQNGVFFACASLQFKGTAIVSGSAVSTGTLLTVTDGVFYDVAILIHAIGPIEFLVFDQYGAWRSTVIENHVPQQAMRLSFSVQRFSTLGYGVLNSFDFRTETFPQ